MRYGPHHVFRVIGGKYALHGYRLLQTGKVRNYQITDQGNQVQLTYVHMNNMYVISKTLIEEIKYNYLRGHFYITYG